MNPSRISVIKLSLMFCFLINLFCLAAANAGEEAKKPELAKYKQTTLGLYVTAAEAYEKWQAAPDSIIILDVRTLEEYIFVGHAPMSRNVPLYYQTDDWNTEKGRYNMQPNSDFVSQVKQVASPDETLLVMCRSGGRGAMAVNQLAEAGFSQVYNIVDGMEGDAIDDPESVFQGQRLKNGWKNSGLPWTYKIDPDRLPLTATEGVNHDSE
mgnify:CR=1 FL=1